MPQSRVLGRLFFILHTFELLNIGGNYIVDCADNTTIYTVISIPHSRSQLMGWLNQNLAAMRFNPKS